MRTLCERAIVAISVVGLLWMLSPQPKVECGQQPVAKVAKRVQV